ncbi:MAG: DUF839 domain-containing protein [Deltaproteobacteria bacterium]|nr:DUF839 domain-containing protein [Deltaproteobacteria bacterium]
MASRSWLGCDDSSSGPGGSTDGGDAAGPPLDVGVGGDAGADATSPPDGGPPDAGPAERTYFPARTLPARPALRSRIADIGPLGDPDENGLRLPAGFRSRVIARSMQVVPGTSHAWHILPDGGATYITEDGGWIYVSNSEMVLNMGGVGAVRFDSSANVVAAYAILEGTNANCAGGPTPWHTWLSCEETGIGRVHECDPWGEHEAVARPALGVFKHEAAAIDPVRAHVYMTEDEGDGCFYRFVPSARTPDGHPDLHAGALEVAVVDATGAVTWRALPDPQSTGDAPTRDQVPESTAFDGGEGIWYHDGVVYFSTKGDNRVWRYDVEEARLTILYDGDAMADPPLRGVDNLTVSCCGDVLVAEDGGSMQVVAILPGGEARPLVQVIGHEGSEITGPAFDPSGTRLYFSSQRSSDGGTTFEIEGPFHEPI